MMEWGRAKLISAAKIAAASVVGVSIDEMKKERHRAASTARYIALWLIRRTDYTMSYPALAKIFALDHSTVIHGVRKIATARGRLAELRNEAIKVFDSLEDRKRGVPIVPDVHAAMMLIASVRERLQKIENELQAWITEHANEKAKQ